MPSNGTTSWTDKEIGESFVVTLILPPYDTTCSIHHFRLVSSDCTSSNGEVDRVFDWRSSAVKVKLRLTNSFDIKWFPYKKFGVDIERLTECNQVITESPNVKLTSSSVPTAAKKHSCQSDSAHLFSHTGWCAKKHDGNYQSFNYKADLKIPLLLRSIRSKKNRTSEVVKDLDNLLLPGWCVWVRLWCAVSVRLITTRAPRKRISSKNKNKTQWDIQNSKGKTKQCPSFESFFHPDTRKRDGLRPPPLFTTHPFSHCLPPTR